MVAAQRIAQLRQDPEDLGQVALLARLDPISPSGCSLYELRRHRPCHKIAPLKHAMTDIGRERLYPALVSAHHLEALVWAVELTDSMRSGP